MKSTFFSAAFAGVILAAGAAGATTLDFTALPSGPVAPNTYSGVTITEQNPGGADVTAAQANIGLISGLTNSEYGYGGDTSRGNYPYYPTEQQIVFNFAAPASGVSFLFDNEGDNGRSTYTAYNSVGGVISSGNIGFDSFVLESVSGSGIASLVVDNGGNDWVYGIQNLTFSGGVPEPASWALMLVGFAGLGGALRSRKAKIA